MECPFARPAAPPQSVESRSAGTDVMPRSLCPSWRWMTISGTPSRAISTAWAWRSWCGAKRRHTPAAAAVRRSSARAAADDLWRPRVVPLMTQRRGPTGSSRRMSSQGPSCSHPHVSMPTSRRRPPLPRRTSSEPRRSSRSPSRTARPPRRKRRPLNGVARKTLSTECRVRLPAMASCSTTRVRSRSPTSR